MTTSSHSATASSPDHGGYDDSSNAKQDKQHHEKDQKFRCAKSTDRQGHHGAQPTAPCPSWCDGDHAGRPWHFGELPAVGDSAAVDTLYLCFDTEERATILVGDENPLTVQQAETLAAALTNAVAQLRADGLAA